MTASDHAHVEPEPAADLFSAREWLEFQKSDREAAKRVVVLLTGIFIVGIVLYSFVVATL